MSRMTSSVRQGAWSAGLLGAVALGCLALACLEPFAAVAVVAAGALPLGRAVGLVLTVWLVGQAAGFGLHDYPMDVSTVGWGLGLGLAAVAATLAAAAILARLPGRPLWFRAGLAFVAAFVADQAMLLGVQQVIEGSCEIVPGVISQIGLLNAAWLAALLAADALARRVLGWAVGFGGARPA